MASNALPPANIGVAVGGIQVHPAGTHHTTTIVEVSGDIDANIANDLRGVLVHLIMLRKPSRIVVDLRGVTGLDSSAIGTLRAAHDVAQDVQVVLVFHTSGSPVAGQLDHDGVPIGPRLNAKDAVPAA